MAATAVVEARILSAKTKSINKNKYLKLNEYLKYFLQNLEDTIKELLKDNKKVTFNQINSVIGLKLNKNYLGWFLKEKLTSSELKKIMFIKHSQIEIDFLNVLNFYFGSSVLGSFELGGKIFDYKLGKNILIELDGEYWHSAEDAKNNDKIKNEIAKTNGFVLIRVSDKHVKSLDFLNNLKSTYDKFKKI